MKRLDGGKADDLAWGQDSARPQRRASPPRELAGEYSVATWPAPSELHTDIDTYSLSHYRTNRQYL